VNLVLTCYSFLFSVFRRERIFPVASSIVVLILSVKNIIDYWRKTKEDVQVELGKEISRYFQWITDGLHKDKIDALTSVDKVMFDEILKKTTELKRLAGIANHFESSVKVNLNETIIKQLPIGTNDELKNRKHLKKEKKYKSMISGIIDVVKHHLVLDKRNQNHHYEILLKLMKKLKYNVDVELIADLMNILNIETVEKRLSMLQAKVKDFPLMRAHMSASSKQSSMATSFGSTVNRMLGIIFDTVTGSKRKIKSFLDGISDRAESVAAIYTLIQSKALGVLDIRDEGKNENIFTKVKKLKQVYLGIWNGLPEIKEMNSNDNIMNFQVYIKVLNAYFFDIPGMLRTQDMLIEEMTLVISGFTALFDQFLKSGLQKLLFDCAKMLYQSNFSTHVSNLVMENFVRAILEVMTPSEENIVTIRLVVERLQHIERLISMEQIYSNNKGKNGNAPDAARNEHNNSPRPHSPVLNERRRKSIFRNFERKAPVELVRNLYKYIVYILVFLLFV
jgi:hypothetical protein